MVIVDTTLTELNDHLRSSITIERLESVLADMGMELDEALGDDLKIEITAERVDLITPTGLARAINCYLGENTYKEIESKKSEYVHVVDSSVKEIRPHTRSFVAKNISLTEEKIKTIMWVQEKIHDTYGRKRKKVAIGLYDLDKIQFPITYSAKTPGDISFIPLETTTPMSGEEILNNHPKGKQFAHLLSGFTAYPIHTDKNNQVLSMPPIINSDDLGKIETNTTNLFVECTGTNEEALDAIMNIVATALFDWGATIEQVTIQYQDKKVVCPNLESKEWTITSEDVNNLIGLKLSVNEIEELLPKMQYTLKESANGKIILSAPSVRTDIWHPVDIADDIARAYGYNNITPKVPNISTIGNMLPINQLKESIAQFLIGFELIEVNTFALTNHTDQYEKMNVDVGEHIQLGKNTQDSNLNMVRSWLLPELIKSLNANRSCEYPQNIFELAIVIEPDESTQTKARNVEKMAVAICEEQADFTIAKQIVDSIFNFLSLEYSSVEKDHPSCLPGRSATILLNEQEIGFIGELHPQVLDNWDMKMPIAAFELNLDSIQEELEKKK